MLVTLVASKGNCFHEPFKGIKTVRIPKFIRQRVPDCRAGVVQRPTAVRAESTARHSETVPVRRAASEAGMRWSGGLRCLHTAVEDYIQSVSVLAENISDS